MAESTTGGARRARRSTRVSRQLAQARERNNRQLVLLREREARVDRALRDYVAATEQIEALDAVFQDKLAQVEERIHRVRTQREKTVAEVRAVQARAVLAIHTAGRTVKQVAELLDLSEKAARQLIGVGRDEAQPDVSASAVAAEAETVDYPPVDRAYEPRVGPEDVRETRQ